MKMMLTGLLQHMSRLLSTRGFSTKIVLTAIDENTPVAVEVLPGQVHEATQVEKMLDATRHVFLRLRKQWRIRDSTASLSGKLWSLLHALLAPLCGVWR
jgi:hypothetical protein